MSAAVSAEEEEFVLEEDENDPDNPGDFSRSDKGPNANPDSSSFDSEAVCSGQSGIKGRGWAGNIVVPDKAPKPVNSVPDENLSLEWVYGYRGYDSWCNVMYDDADETGNNDNIIYPQAGVIVVYDQKLHKQKILCPGEASKDTMRHNDDIICLAQNPQNKNVFASGQVASIVDGKSQLPRICVWNSGDFAKDFVCFPDAHEGSVLALGFSSDGKYLASVGCDNNFTIKIWDLKSKQVLLTQKSGTTKIYKLEWNPIDPNQFVTVGIKSIYFWDIDVATRKLKGTKANLGKMPLQTFYSVTWTDKGYCCIATRDGSIYILVQGECKKVIKDVHANAKTFALFYHNAGEGGLISGGSDGKVVFFDKKLTRLGEIDVQAPVKSLYVRKSEGGQVPRLLIGTDRSIFTLDDFLNFGVQSRPTPAVEGHWDGEVWGLDCHPDGNRFATCGEDNTICLWDLRTRRLLKKGIINSKFPAPSFEEEAKAAKSKASTTSEYGPSQSARALSFNSDGSMLVLGLNNGYVQVHDSELNLLFSHDLNSCAKKKKDNSNNWIQTIKHSPDGKVCAVGTHGAVIVLLDTADGYKPKKTLGEQKNSAAVTFMDFSSDSKFLRTNSLDYKLDFW